MTHVATTAGTHPRVLTIFGASRRLRSSVPSSLDIDELRLQAITRSVREAACQANRSLITTRDI